MPKKERSSIRSENLRPDRELRPGTSLCPAGITVELNGGIEINNVDAEQALDGNRAAKLQR